MSRTTPGDPAGPAPIGLADLAGLIFHRDPGARVLVALAGAPCSGKSTTADSLRALIEERQPGTAAILPMDGYHLDDTLLKARGMRARKGSPGTFDVGGLAAMLCRLRRNEEDEIFVPVFDRDIEIARGAARAVPRACRIVLVEGNYLLLDRDPWRALRRHFDISVTVHAPMAEILRRMDQRWISFGLSAADRSARIRENDLPNAETVMTGSVPAEFVVSTLGN
ncbi:MAG: nucleoside/nucleotide kinase family protein [Paracoccaceae bacterium]